MHTICIQITFKFFSNCSISWAISQFHDKVNFQLSNNAIKYVNKNYKSPEDVIKGKIEGEYLNFITHVTDFLKVKVNGMSAPIEADYTIELNFKEGKVKYEVISLDMH